MLREFFFWIFMTLSMVVAAMIFRKFMRISKFETIVKFLNSKKPLNLILCYMNKMPSLLIKHHINYALKKVIMRKPFHAVD